MRSEMVLALFVSCALTLTSVTTFVDEGFVPDENAYGDATGRVCGGPANTDSITILPPGPVTLPADQSRVFNATLYDSDGIPLGGSPDWSVSDGSIVAQGGGEAIYYPTSIGNHTVYACAAEVTVSVDVIVTMGATQQIELVGNKVNLTADDVVLFDVIEYDLHGNNGTMFVPSSGWTIPAGSNLHALPGQPAVWTPASIGNHTIEVTASGFTAQWQVNVSRGVGTALIIDVDRTSITADESATMTMAVTDRAGNLVPVTGTWSALATQAQNWLSVVGTTATFDGTRPGNWTVRGYYSGPETGHINLSDDVIISVTVGAISLVTIDGHDSTILTGDSINLNPTATDLDGNIVETATFNWTLEGASMPASLDEYNHTFTPTTVGQHTLIADSGGRSASIRVQVEWSIPVEINVTDSDGDWYLTVTTGETLELHVKGKDVMGEWHPYDTTWQVDERVGTIEAATGTGEYLYHASSVNWTQLLLFAGGDEYTILVYVTPGMLDHLEITISERGMQGEELPMVISGYDVSGNGVSIPTCDVTVTSSAGKAYCDERGWWLGLENDGEQHVITVSYEGAEGTAFIDVQPILLGGIFGTSTNVVAFAAGGIALLIVAVLLFSYQRVKRLAEAEDDDEEEDEKDERHVAIGLRKVAQQPSPKGGNHGELPPLPAAKPMPPPSILFKQPLKKAAPAPPPPPFMFGTGIAPNSSSAHPQPGVFVRSEGRYGWGDQQQVGQSEYGWEAGVTAASPPPPHQPKWGDPGLTGAAHVKVNASPLPPQSINPAPPSPPPSAVQPTSPPAPAPPPPPPSAVQPTSPPAPAPPPPPPLAVQPTSPPAPAPPPPPTVQPTSPPAPAPPSPPTDQPKSATAPLTGAQPTHPRQQAQDPLIAATALLGDTARTNDTTARLGDALSLLSTTTDADDEDVSEPSDAPVDEVTPDPSEESDVEDADQGEQNSVEALASSTEAECDSEESYADADIEPTGSGRKAETDSMDDGAVEVEDSDETDAAEAASTPTDSESESTPLAVESGESSLPTHSEGEAEVATVGAALGGEDEQTEGEPASAEPIDEPEESVDAGDDGETRLARTESSEVSDGWGEWGDSWDEDPSEPLPGLGPCTDDGEVLKPLPGTRPGESGWYFDVDGKPSLWEFRPMGWERVK